MRKMLVGTAVGVLATALVGTIAIAQQPDEVKVEASRIVKTVASKGVSGVEIVDMSLSYGVSYAGLDLASRAGAVELERRISAAAHKACKELGRQYPDSTPSDPECTRVTTDKGLVAAHALEASAGKR